MIKIDLQHFADGVFSSQEIDKDENELPDEEETAKVVKKSSVVADDETEDESEIEDDEEETEETEDDEKSKAKKPLTAQEKAIIKEKQKNKELRDKLADFDRKEQERQQEEEKHKLKAKLIDKGLSEEDAEDEASLRVELKQIRTEQERFKYERQAEKLESRFPDIMENLDSLISLCKKGLTLEEACKAKLDEMSPSDARLKVENEMAYKKSKAAALKVDPGASSNEKAVTKLTNSQERAFKFENEQLKRMKVPQITRSDFLKKYQGIV